MSSKTATCRGRRPWITPFFNPSTSALPSQLLSYKDSPSQICTGFVCTLNAYLPFHLSHHSYRRNKAVLNLVLVNILTEKEKITAAILSEYQNTVVYLSKRENYAPL